MLLATPFLTQCSATAAIMSPNTFDAALSPADIAALFQPRPEAALVFDPALKRFGALWAVPLPRHRGTPCGIIWGNGVLGISLRQLAPTKAVVRWMEGDHNPGRGTVPSPTFVA